jgi:hypothetical protein
MSTMVKQAAFWSIFTLAHAGLTILLLLLYVNYAMKVDHGWVEPTTVGTISQYLKSIAFLPILLPILHWRADLATGALGGVPGGAAGAQDQVGERSRPAPLPIARASRIASSSACS